jgi:NAD+ synthase (glutamine-hydrolysing)
MPALRIALAQVNPTVGDLDGNADIIVEWSRRAASAGADLVVFPEMMLTGYPVEDLALRASFIDASIAALRGIAGRLAAGGMGDLAVVTGYLDRREGVAPRTGLPANAPLDAAALLYRGEIAVRTAKHHLPNYGVFDEYRYFLPGDTMPVFRMTPRYGPAGGAADGADGAAGGAAGGLAGRVDVAIAVCEDLWQDGGPVALTREAGAGLLVVPNASPYEHGKDDVRLDLCARRAKEAGAVLAYVNMTGGQDELVFDGDSIIVDASGRPIVRGPQFGDALVVADVELPAPDPAREPGRVRADAHDGTTMTINRLELPPPRRSGGPRPALPPAHWPRLSDPEEIYTALVTGVRDYVQKNGFRSVILGLSGGIDSALTATIATDAVGPDAVHVVLMPSPYSSEHSVADAEELVKRQGLRSATVPISGIVDAFEAELDLHGLAAENLQARIRGTILMSLSNEHGHLVLTTGNKSEIATGYSTLYGDSAGGFGPVKDVSKTLVWELARWRNADAARRGETPPIPENSITKPPSAELAPGQLDSDRLPDYAMLDRLLHDYVVEDMGAAGLAEAGYDPQLIESVIRMVDRAEYKRRQYPPGPKITPKNFGRDRRLPITNRWREQRPGGT